MRDAGEAFDALAELLGEARWFFGAERPGLFDASVFAYTHLIVGTVMRWRMNGLGEMLGRHPNLVLHQERIAEMYFQS